MAVKKYMVSQIVDLNGKNVTGGFIVETTEADLQKLLPLLEGKYTVMEENASLSGGSDTTVADIVSAPGISLTHTTPDGKYVPFVVKPYRGHILFKNTVNRHVLADTLVNTSFCSYAPTAKVKRAGIFGSAEGQASNE